MSNGQATRAGRPMSKTWLEAYLLAVRKQYVAGRILRKASVQRRLRAVLPSRKSGRHGVEQ